MVSERRIEANRRNAQRSTGPRSPEGRARSSMNALRRRAGKVDPLEVTVRVARATNPQHLSQADVAQPRRVEQHGSNQQLIPDREERIDVESLINFSRSGVRLLRAGVLRCRGTLYRVCLGGEQSGRGTQSLSLLHCIGQIATRLCRPSVTAPQKSDPGQLRKGAIV